jgi:hypothetical protein
VSEAKNLKIQEYTGRKYCLLFPEYSLEFSRHILDSVDTLSDLK